MVVWNYSSRLSYIAGSLSGHIMYGFNRCFCSAGVVAVGRWCCLTVSAEGILIWIIVGQGLTVLVVGAGRGCSDIFSLAYHFSFLVPPSRMNGYPLILRPFQQYFIYSRMMGG